MALLQRSPVKEEVTAVDEVSLTVPEGRLFALIGPNGAGKTTLIKMLSTLLLPTSGKATVSGHDLVHESSKVKQSIGFVASEERSFYWRLTGRQNLRFFAALHNLGPLKAEERTIDVLRRVELENSADNMFYTYSSGMKQKLAIARGLLTDPMILFLDEPTKSVDPKTGEMLKRFLKDVLVGQDGRTILFTTHRLEEAEELADNLAVMDKGKVVFNGTLDELKNLYELPKRYLIKIQDLPAEVVAEVCNSYSEAGFSVQPRTFKSQPGVELILTNGSNPLSSLVGDILNAGGHLVSCQFEDVKLADVFLKIVGDSEDDTP